MKRFVYLFLLFLIPLEVFAYSNQLAVGGDLIGIEIHSNGVYVIDFYPVHDKMIAKEEGFLKGDFIYKIDGEDIKSSLELNKSLENGGEHIASIKRKDKSFNLTITSYLVDDHIETGLYVKDVINGVGTLSYIDPDTKVFASLGHEIQESKTNQKFDLYNGYIYDAKLNYIHKSSDGHIGEYHANFINSIKGNILKNEINGIYGKYMGDIDSLEQKEIAPSSSIQLGDASIRFLMDEEVGDYSIQILDIKEKEKVKNIFFEITDERVLSKTGGIVQGMSGSPILQNDKIIGVVNYVLVNDAKKGYGIFIEKMLEEGDRILK